MAISSRLNGIGEYYFSAKLAEIAAMNKAGADVINLGIGSPDLPPHPSVIKVLAEESAKASSHGYQSYKGIEPLRNALSAWYLRSYGVKLNPASEILPLIGSKEGIMHVCMTYLEKGDLALVPNPGYPTYRTAVQLAGGTCVDYILSGSDNWQIDFEALEKNDLSKVKIMWVNYPHMPTGKAGDRNLFQKLIDFGRKHNILICHDNPYSFILNDQPLSLLEMDGAMEHALELNSLSKSHNMAGWRIGMVAASSENIDAILRFKSNMDSGMFLPLQLAAVKALSLDSKWFAELNEVYEKRKEKAMELLDLLSAEYSRKQSGLFLWAKVPGSYADGYALSDKILQDARVFITPGGIFGSAGDPYIRLSLCSTIEKFEESIQRIKKV